MNGENRVYLRQVTATVLLVEDEPDLAHVMSVALRRAGHNVITADCGAAALAATDVHPVDVVVLDRGLPDMDGTEVATRMRAAGYGGTILIASGHSGEDHVTMCRDAGADGVLVKPFTLSELVGRIRTLDGGPRGPIAGRDLPSAS
jgi:DNA-binding response OmpR family regulator